MLSDTYRVPDIYNIYFRYILHIGDQLDTYRYFVYINNISGTRFYCLKRIKRMSQKYNLSKPPISKLLTTDMLFNVYRGYIGSRYLMIINICNILFVC
jgi:hypothetical protein